MTTFRHLDAVRSVIRTAVFNGAATIAAGLGGILIARTLGPTVQGEYAAITAWFSVIIILGDMGQQAALCYYVASDPGNAREHVATSRTIMLTAGIPIIVICLLIAPLLAHGNRSVLVGYRIAFIILFIAFIGASYIIGLQGRDLSRWNRVSLSQPVLSLFAFVLLWRLRWLNLDVALLVLAGTMLAQFAYAYSCCRSVGLAPGNMRISLVRPLAVYGVAQIATAAPTVLNTRLDLLVLSQAVPAADLGRYAVAVSLTAIPLPLCSAIGNVAFPRLAARRSNDTKTDRLQWLAVFGSAVIAIAVLLPLSFAASWLVPTIFGPSYNKAVPIVWVLAPAALFMACGQVTGDLLRGTKRPMVVAKAQTIAAVATLALLVLLLPFIGVYAAAVASTVAYGISLAIMMWALWRSNMGTSRVTASGEISAASPLPCTPSASVLSQK